ncbi:MAG: T9SS type A sorting domain-containing protein [Chitinophagaceae bacterium]|nr:T9SS type A sorting domain-containing protein [Chitinophagaceae bacterium]MCB9045577.1 T9SS type A sorting domain-containing protein [Chitinophagales bacterium]
MKKPILYKLAMFIVSVFLCTTGFSQASTINTSTTTGYNGSNSSGTNGFITFVLKNNSGMAMKITQVGNWATTSHNNTVSTLWYSAVSLSGPVTLAQPDWQSVASNTVTGVTTSGVFPVIPVMSFEIPNNTTYRFAVHTTGTNNYTSGTPTVNTFTTAGVTMYTGDYQISGSYVGYAVSNNPRFFTGFVTFEPACVTAFTAQPMDVSLCALDSVTISAVADPVNNYHWQLNKGSGWIDLGNDATYGGTTTNNLRIKNTSMAMNNYKYRAVATNTAQGCSVNSDPATLSMIPSSTSTILVSADPSTTICENEEVVFHTAYTKGGTTPQYRWLLNGLEIQGETKAFLKTTKLDHGDIVQCRFISSEQCVFESMSSGIKFSIVSNLLAEVGITTSYNGGNSYTFIADPKNGGVSPKYVWYVNGKLVPNENGQSFTTDALKPWDKVTVGMQTSRDCAQPKMATSRIATTDVSEVVKTDENIVLSPNPNNGNFTIKSKSLLLDGASVYITNAIGQIVYKADINSQNHTSESHIDMGNNAAPGMYLVHVKSAGTEQVLKFAISQ